MDSSRGVCDIFSMSFQQFLANTTFHGCKLILMLRNLIYERFIWVIIVLSTIGFSIYVVLVGWFSFTENPTFTSLVSQEYPITNVPFPALAICSLNKISRSAALVYAVELNRKLKNRSNVNTLLNGIRNLGALIDLSPLDKVEAAKFQEILDSQDSDSNGAFDSHSRMKMLAPKCQDILIRCMWEGKDLKCEKLFKFHATPDGFCCTFNFVQPEIVLNNTATIIRASERGENSGLTLLLNSSTVDYFYNNRNTVGFSIQIFDSITLPDGTTGQFNEFILNPGQEAFLNLLVSTIYSLDAVRQYAIYQRKCYFNNERSEEFGNYYSYSECLTKCKIRSIMALCNCIPFFITDTARAPRGLRTYCNLGHITCLSRYKTTWNTYRPEVMGTPGLEREEEDSLNCPNCLPSCAETTYTYGAVSTRLQAPQDLSTDWGILKGIRNFKEVSLLKIYFASSTSLLYKRDVIYTWYEIVASIGGILGFCLGVSILSFVEIIYFFTFKFYENYAYRRLNHVNNITIASLEKSVKELNDHLRKKNIFFQYLK